MSRRAINSGAVGFSLFLALTSSAEALTINNFRARVTLVQTGDPRADVRCPAPMVLVEFSGRATVTRLGGMDAEASHCIIDDPADPEFSRGELTLSDARGSIFIEYSGLDMGGDLTGTWTATGGSGDYAGATGGGTLSGTAGADVRRGVVRLEGTLTIP